MWPNRRYCARGSVLSPLFSLFLGNSCLVTECQSLSKLHSSHSLWVHPCNHWPALGWCLSIILQQPNMAQTDLVISFSKHLPALSSFLLMASLVFSLPGRIFDSFFPNVSCKISIPIADILARSSLFPVWGSPYSSPSYILMIMLLSSKCLNHLPFSKQISIPHCSFLQVSPQSDSILLFQPNFNTLLPSLVFPCLECCHCTHSLQNTTGQQVRKL